MLIWIKINFNFFVFFCIQKASPDQPPTDPVHRPKIHASAYKQATGEAVYCDDIPKHDNELYLVLVLSTKAHANIVLIDPSDALQEQGVTAFFSAKDLPAEQNICGPLAKDEEIFVSKTVTSHGQILGAIVAEDRLTARRAAGLVKIVYEDIFPVIITIEDAIAHNSILPGFPIIYTSGDVEKAMKASDHVVKGKVRLGGQEHFYLETHTCLVVPKDSDELEIFASTQQPGEVQQKVAQILGIPANRVVCRAKRLGGGFGGKETRSVFTTYPAAIAAFKLNRPVRMVLDRDEDMQVTGGRHPFLFEYEVAFDKNGRINACNIKAYNNAGFSLDYSSLVLEKAVHQIQNAYNIENMRIESFCMKTNTVTNTAFRGFGSPQAMLLSEHVVRDVARVLKRDYLEIMAINMFKTGDKLHYNQVLDDCASSRCFEEVKVSSDLENRRKDVEKFNMENRWRKRGISLVNTMFSIGFTPKYLNQATALVLVYRDGAILISHGGVEMGQGLHTKMMQIASRVFEVPIDRIHVQETATDKVPNATSTAASVSSDLYGGAVLKACQIIYDRLAPYREQFPDKGWDDWISKAYFDRVSLSTTGFFKTENIGDEINRPYNYFTHGAAVSEVEIDSLTGDHQIIRTDIVMDVGSSLNPAIDIGQIEGGFMQGCGLFTLEELVYSPDGTLHSRGPGMYKLPGFSDIPAEFNVSLLTGSSNPRAVYSSKAVGEPPLFLASSVFFAIKEAISAARSEGNLDPNVFLESPATAARIRMACQDAITESVS